MKGRRTSSHLLENMPHGLFTANAVLGCSDNLDISKDSNSTIVSNSSTMLEGSECFMCMSSCKAGWVACRICYASLVGSLAQVARKPRVKTFHPESLIRPLLRMARYKESAMQSAAFLALGHLMSYPTAQQVLCEVSGLRQGVEQETLYSADAPRADNLDAIELGQFIRSKLESPRYSTNGYVGLHVAHGTLSL